MALERNVLQRYGYQEKSEVKPVKDQAASGVLIVRASQIPRNHQKIRETAELKGDDGLILLIVGFLMIISSSVISCSCEMHKEGKILGVQVVSGDKLSSNLCEIKL